MIRVILAVAYCVLATSPAATTIIVPTDRSTIQAAVDVAKAGDTVLVSPGVYYENITLRGLDIVLTSYFIRTGDKATVDATVIDGSHLTRGDSLGSVISIVSGESIATQIVGFTIQGGIGTKSKGTLPFYGRRGAGILIEHASATVVSNVFTRNGLTGNYCQGAGVSIKWSNSIVRDNNFHDNRVDGINFSRGAAVYLELTTSTVIAHNLMSHNVAEVITLLDASALIDSNQIIENNGTAIVISNPVTPPVAIMGNVVLNNTGVGIYANYIDFRAQWNLLAGNAGGVECRACDADLRNNTIVGNQSSQPGGGFYKYWFNTTDVNLENNIFWDNSSAGGGPEVYFEQNALVTLTSNDIRFGRDSIYVGPGVTLNWGSENISLDPLFCNDTAGIYTISAASPCAPTIDNSYTLIGALSVGCGFCGDVNLDGHIDHVDLNELIAYYFYYSTTSVNYATMDLDCDGMVGLVDICKLVSFLDGLLDSPCCGNKELSRSERIKL